MGYLPKLDDSHAAEVEMATADQSKSDWVDVWALREHMNKKDGLVNKLAYKHVEANSWERKGNQIVFAKRKVY